MSNIIPTKIGNSFKVDTSSIFYVHTFSKHMTQQFRATANLSEPVNRDVLIEAVSKMPKRFPTFFVVLQTTFIKRFYEKKIFEPSAYVFDDVEICSPFDMTGGTSPLFRVICGDKYIALEVFHGIADGSGALTFFKSLLTVYFNLLGDNIPFECGALDVTQEATAAETEDSFLRVYDPKGKRNSRTAVNAFQAPVYEDSKKLNVSVAHFSSADVRKCSKALGVSVTEFITAAYAYSFFLAYGKTDKPVLIQVPINLRTIFPSETVRNFSLYCTTGIPKGELDNSFEHMLELTREQLNEGKKKENLQREINTNVHDAEMPITKIAPVVLRGLALKICGKIVGENLCTSPLSNLGLVSMSPALSKYVDSLDIVIGRTSRNTVSACAITYKDILSLNIAARDPHSKLPETFFSFVREKIEETNN